MRGVGLECKEGGVHVGVEREGVQYGEPGACICNVLM